MWAISLFPGFFQAARNSESSMLCATSRYRINVGDRTPAHSPRLPAAAG